MRTSLLTLGLLAVPQVAAWGSLGHVTVAHIATAFVSNTTEAYLQSLLRNPTDTYLSKIATWADSYKYSKWGHFTSTFHFIDAKDNPPTDCNVDYTRDCKASGCIVSALQNYTSRMLDHDLPAWDRAMAAKFVVHFVGDVHQPLHTENVARGGNGIHVKWRGRNWNLHHVWDTTIAEEIVGGHRRNPYPQAAAWGRELAGDIEDGEFEHVREGWLKGMDLKEPIDSVMVWTREANALVCSTVMPEGPHEIQGQELSGDYYDETGPVVKAQVARAGYRLAKWLDLIVDEIMATGGSIGKVDDNEGYEAVEQLQVEWEL